MQEEKQEAQAAPTPIQELVFEPVPAEAEATDAVAVEATEERYAHVVQLTPTCQAKKLYLWEDSALPDSMGGCYLTLTDCQEFVNTVWEDLGLRKPPKVLDGRGSHEARSWGDRIMLPRWSRNYSVLTHELAHCVADLIDTDDNHDHGGIFIHVFFTLMARYCEHKYDDLYKSATAYGLRIERIKLASRLKYLSEEP